VALGPAVRLTAALALGALLAWWVATLVGVAASSLVATVVLRSLLTCVVLILITRVVVRGAYARPGVAAAAVVGAVSCVLSPPSWAGRALVGQVVLGPGPAAALVDLLVWTAVVVLAARTARPRRRAPRYQAVHG